MSSRRNDRQQLLEETAHLIRALDSREFSEAERWAARRGRTLERLAASAPEAGAPASHLERARELDAQLNARAQAALEDLRAELFEIREERSAWRALRDAAREQPVPRFVSERA